MSIAVGEICEGVVTGITQFGAFVKLDDEVTGLVHISEVADSYVRDVSEHLAVGDTVYVKVMSIGGGKVALSIKRAEIERRASNERFESKLAEFMKSSNEKLTQLRRHQERR